MTLANTAARKLAHAHTSASQLAKDLNEGIRKARTFGDPHLSPEGTAEKRRTLEAEFRATGRADFDKLASDLSWARTHLADAARAAAGVPRDASAVALASAKWTMVQQRLESGHDLGSIIRTADEDTVRAVAEFAPAWAASKYSTPGGLDGALRASLGETPVDASAAISKAVYRRLAEVATDRESRELFAAEAAADAQMAPATPWLDAASSIVERGGADMLGAALASSIAASEAAATQPSTTAA